MSEVTEKVPLSELPPSVQWVVDELGLADSKGRVARETVRTLGEFLLRFGQAGQPGATAASDTATPDKPRRGRPPKSASGAPPRPTERKPRRRTRPTKAEVRGELTRKIAEHLRLRPGSTLAEIAAALDAPLTDVSVAAKPVDWLVLEESELTAPSSRVESDAITATRERANGWEWPDWPSPW